MNAHEEAVARIWQARETGAEVLDLGDLALERLPDEVGDLPALRVLALGKATPRRRQFGWRFKQVAERSWSQFRDLTPLKGLRRLRSLDLSHCRGVNSLLPLAELKALRRIDLRGCTQIIELSVLGDLSMLAFLNVGALHRVQDFQFLTRLTSLQRLGLHGCTGFSDPTPIGDLVNLRSLDLCFCRNLRCFTAVKPRLAGLTKLLLFGSKFEDLPPEVFGTSANDNAIDRVRAHFADLDHAPTTDPELKLFLLGNGGVGKTQLCNRLRDLPFDPSIPSTHGILSHDAPLAVPGLDEPARLHLWDFGGQDVYHGSHALFLHAHAITLLLWHSDREAGFWHEPGSDLRLTQRPLPYWLDYIRGLVGTADPLLIIQSQCEKASERRPSPAPRPDDLPHCHELAVSARTGFGLRTLQGAIEEAAQAVLERRPPFPIGRGRIEVRDRIRQMRADDALLPPHERKHRTLTRPEFDAICADNGKISDPSALLDFFHQTGVVFYRPNLVDHIIVDLSWAFDAVYALLHRTDTLPALRALRGRFTLSTLRGLTVWQAHTLDEQRLFLGVMLGCGICFAVRRDNQETEYVAPELLPEWSAVQREVLGPLQHKKAAIRAEVRYRYLHEGIQRAFLSRVGTQAQDAPIYWKYGLWLYDARTDSQALVESTLGGNAERPGEGSFTFQAWGREPARLIESLLQSLLSLPMAHTPEVTRHGYDPDHRDRHEPSELQATTPPTTADNREVFISYAWGNDSS